MSSSITSRAVRGKTVAIVFLAIIGCPHDAWGHVRGRPKGEDIERKPISNEASGIAVPDRSKRTTSRWSWVGRVLLFPPRIIIHAATQPIWLGLMVYERYDLEKWFYRVFFTPNRVAGWYPIARLESGFGAYLGARLIHKSVFGRGERFRGEIGYGQRFGRIYSFSIDSGNRLTGGNTKLIAGATHRVNPSDRFFGIGDSDLHMTSPSNDRLDPHGEIAVATRFTSNQARVEVGIRHRLAHRWFGRIVHRWTWVQFDTARFTSGDPKLERVFDTERLVGYETGLSNLYIGYRVNHDSRRWASHVSRATPTRGGMVEAEAGYVAGIGNDPSNFLRTRLDLQWFVHLYGGDRVLRLRAFVDAVWGRNDAVSFFDLPSLGGPYHLRGYARARFRDRVATLGTVEYIYPIHPGISGFLFLDPGRVWHRFREFDLLGLRLGYGGGVEIHSKSSFFLRLQIASSIDGGLQVQLNFDPGYARKNR